tara:strand:+ start:51 stop:431 length:381 start_codon:yes stop_codon:yes gene_type:complete
MIASSSGFAQFEKSLQHSILHDDLLEFSKKLDFKSADIFGDMDYLDSIQSKIVILQECKTTFPGFELRFNDSRHFLDQLMKVSIVASELREYNYDSRLSIIKPQVSFIFHKLTEDQRRTVCRKLII